MEKNGKKRRHVMPITCVCVIAALVITSVACIAHRYVQHERRQNERIQSLESLVSKLSAEIQANSTDDIAWLDDGFNYLAIGNSITLHYPVSYWWNEVGMAASQTDRDYFHIVSAHLRQDNDAFAGQAFNFVAWEAQGQDRDETLPFLDPYLSPKLDLVTVQLAENASDLTTYEADYVSLINYIKERAPGARILVIGDFWIKNNRNDLKINAVNATGVEYVSLDGIAGNSDYYCGMGAVVYGSDGQAHVVEHKGVAKHPGDRGMQAIADRIIDTLG